MNVAIVTKAAKSFKRLKPNVKGTYIEPLTKLSPHKQLPVAFIKKTEKEMKVFCLVPHFLKGIVPRNVGYSHMTQGS